MRTTPDRLRLAPDGTLSLEGGGDVAEYLQQWAARFFKDHPGEAMPVCLLYRERLRDLHFTEAMILCA